MAYSRREVADGVTVMNKDLYDNLQDGIDEIKTSFSVLSAQVVTRTDGELVNSDGTEQVSDV